MKTKFRNLICETAIIYAAIVLIMNVIIFIQYKDAIDGANFAASRTLLFFPGALLLSLATLVRKSEVIASVIKWIIHFFLIVIGVYAFLILPGMTDQTGNQKIVGLAATALIYIVIMVIIFCVIRKVKRTSEDAQRYSKKF